MAYFIALGILSLAGVVGTVWLIRTDGYGRIPTDPSRALPREHDVAAPEAAVESPTAPVPSTSSVPVAPPTSRLA